MKKAVLLSLLVVAVQLALGVKAQAQQPKKVSRIGYLSALDPATDSVRVEGIRLALRERGYIEGQNIAVEYRYAEGRPKLSVAHNSKSLLASSVNSFRADSGLFRSVVASFLSSATVDRDVTTPSQKPCRSRAVRGLDCPTQI